MPLTRATYTKEVAACTRLLSRVERDNVRPKVWRDAVKEQTESLMRLLLAADHHPKGDNAAERMK